MSDSTEKATRDGSAGQDTRKGGTAEPTQLDAASLGDSIVAWWRAMPSTGLKWALAIDALVLALYVLGAAFWQRSVELWFFVNLEREANPPSWWFGIQQLLVAIVFLMLASRLFESDERIRPLRALFLVSGIGFGFISLDEIGEVHEIGSRLLARSDAIGNLAYRVEHGVFHIKQRIHGGGLWIVVYAIIGVILLFWLVPQVIRAFKLWPREVGLVAVGFGVFAFSAAVLQVLGYFTKVGTMAHYIYVFVEQGLKMAGISIALYGTLLVLSAGAILLTQRLSSANRTQP